MEVRLETQEVGDVLAIKVLDKRIKHDQSDDFGQQVKKGLEAYRPKKVLLNLEEVEYMSSNNLGIIVAIHKEITGEGGQFRVVVANKTVQEILKITNLHRVLSLYASASEALNGY